MGMERAAQTADVVLREMLDRDETWAALLEDVRGDPAEVVAEAGRFRSALGALGHEFERVEVEHALLSLAGHEPPGAPPGALRGEGWGSRATAKSYPDDDDEWDHAWSDELHARAVAYLEGHGIREALTPAEEAAYIELAIRAMLAGDRAGYRRALRGWIEAAREVARGGSSPAA